MVWSTLVDYFLLHKHTQLNCIMYFYVIEENWVSTSRTFWVRCIFSWQNIQFPHTVRVLYIYISDITPYVSWHNNGSVERSIIHILNELAKISFEIRRVYVYHIKGQNERCRAKILRVVGLCESFYFLWWNTMHNSEELNIECVHW